MRDVNYGNGRKIKSCDRRGWPEMPSAEEERKDRPVKILSPLPRSLPSLSAVCLLIVLAGYCLNGQRFSMKRALRISIFPFFIVGSPVSNKFAADSNPVPKISSRASRLAICVLSGKQQASMT